MSGLDLNCSVLVTKSGAYRPYGHAVGYASHPPFTLPWGPSVEFDSPWPLAAKRPNRHRPRDSRDSHTGVTACQFASVCCRLTLLQPSPPVSAAATPKGSETCALVRDGGWTKASTRHPSRGFVSSVQTKSATDSGPGRRLRNACPLWFPRGCTRLRLAWTPALLWHKHVGSLFLPRPRPEHKTISTHPHVPGYLSTALEPPAVIPLPASPSPFTPFPRVRKKPRPQKTPLTRSNLLRVKKMEPQRTRKHTKNRACLASDELISPASVKHLLPFVFLPFSCLFVFFVAILLQFENLCIDFPRHMYILMYTL